MRVKYVIPVLIRLFPLLELFPCPWDSQGMDFVGIPIPAKLLSNIDETELTRRLASANVSCVSIHVTKILARTGNVVDPVKFFPHPV